MEIKNREIDRTTQKDRAIAGVQQWVEEFVVGQNVCPFAKRSFDENAIYYAYSDAKELKVLLKGMWEVIQHMECSHGEAFVSNSLFVIDTDITFEGLLEFGGICEEFLQEAHFSERYQLVEFHPEFLFAESAMDDAANYVNRSPLPFIHILRVHEVTEAIRSHKDVHSVPITNAEHLRSIGSKKLHEKLEALKRTIK